MAYKKISLLLLFFCFQCAHAEHISLSLTNMQTNETQSFKLGKQITIPIKGLKGWKICVAYEPKSKYIDGLKMHVRQYAVECLADSGVSIGLVCALRDAKKDFHGVSTTLYANDDSQPDSRMLVTLSCLK